MSIKPLKVKILGSGNAAAKHKAAFAQLPHLYEVTDGAHDIVDICTINSEHCTQADAALSSGKHAIVEKPVCGSLAEADHLAALERITGKRIAPIFQYRFAAHQPVRSRIYTSWQRDGGYRTGWRGNWETSLGGCTTTHGIHAIDLMIARYGMPSEIEFGNVILAPGRGPEIFSDFLLVWPDAIRSVVTEIVGAQLQVPTFQLGNSHQGYMRQFRLIHAALTEGTRLPVTLADARQSLEVLTACYAAYDSYSRVKLPIDRDHLFYQGWTRHLAPPRPLSQSSPRRSVSPGSQSHELA